jgi:hypothetical protein
MQKRKLRNSPFHLHFSKLLRLIILTLLLVSAPLGNALAGSSVKEKSYFQLRDSIELCKRVRQIPVDPNLVVMSEVVWEFRDGWVLPLNAADKGRAFRAGCNVTYRRRDMMATFSILVIDVSSSIVARSLLMNEIAILAKGAISLEQPSANQYEIQVDKARWSSNEVVGRFLVRVSPKNYGITTQTRREFLEQNRLALARFVAEFRKASYDLPLFGATVYDRAVLQKVWQTPVTFVTIVGLILSGAMLTRRRKQSSPVKARLPAGTAGPGVVEMTAKAIRRRRNNRLWTFGVYLGYFTLFWNLGPFGFVPLIPVFMFSWIRRQPTKRFFLLPSTMVLFAYAAAIVSGILSLLAAQFSLEEMSRSFSAAGFLFMLVALASFVLIYPAYRWSFTKNRKTIELALRKDSRPPLLLLRSFGDDPLRVPFDRSIEKRGGWERFFLRLTDRLESVLARAMWQKGPVLAVGEPGVIGPTLGAARVYFPEADQVAWQNWVTTALAASQVVVVVLGPTAGVRWEMKESLSARCNTLFVVPMLENHIDFARAVNLQELLSRTDTPLMPENTFAVLSSYGKVSFLTLDNPALFVHGLSLAIEHAAEQATGPRNVSAQVLLSDVSVRYPDRQVRSKLLRFCVLFGFTGLTMLTAYGLAEGVNAARSYFRNGLGRTVKTTALPFEYKIQDIADSGANLIAATENGTVFEVNEKREKTVAFKVSGLPYEIAAIDTTIAVLVAEPAQVWVRTQGLVKTLTLDSSGSGIATSKDFVIWSEPGLNRIGFVPLSTKRLRATFARVEATPSDIEYCGGVFYVADLSGAIRRFDPVRSTFEPERQVPEGLSKLHCGSEGLMVAVPSSHAIFVKVANEWNTVPGIPQINPYGVAMTGDGTVLAIDLEKPRMYRVRVSGDRTIRSVPHSGGSSLVLHDQSVAYINESGLLFAEIGETIR